MVKGVVSSNSGAMVKGVVSSNSGASVLQKLKRLWA